MATHDKHITVV